MEERRRTILHVGCGSQTLDDWVPFSDYRQWKEIRIDIDASQTPEIISSITDLACIPDQSADAAWVFDCLEYLHIVDAVKALTSLRRVLRKEGILYLCVPDLTVAAQQILQNRSDVKIGSCMNKSQTPIEMLYGTSVASAWDDSGLRRHAYTLRSIQHHLSQVGFLSASTCKIPALEGRLFLTVSQAGGTYGQSLCSEALQMVRYQAA